MEPEKIRLMKTSGKFLLVMLLILMALNFAYLQLVFSRKNIQRNEIQFNQYYDENLRVIFFGDSIVAFAINPAYINNSFNYAVQGETYDQTYYKLRKFAEKNNISAFVFPINLHSFSDYRQADYSDALYWLNFMTVGELSKETDKSLLDIYLGQYLPFLGRGEEFGKVLFNGENTYMFKGWQKKTGDFGAGGNKSKKAYERVESQLIGYPKAGSKLLDYFLKIVALANSTNKKIILMKYPATEDYISAVSTKINITKFYSLLNQSISKYNNIHFLDYQKFTNNSSLFNDPDHLNYLGAQVFSEQVNSDLKWVLDLEKNI